jgi:hypothetical protein
MCLSSLVKTRVKLRITESTVHAAACRTIRADLLRSPLKGPIRFGGNEESKTIRRCQSLTSNGAFVDIGGVDGMDHIPSFHGSIKIPPRTDVGDAVTVHVSSFEKEKRNFARLRFPATIVEQVLEHYPRRYGASEVVKLKRSACLPKSYPCGRLFHITQITTQRIGKQAMC